jgi:hypothetical protein
MARIENRAEISLQILDSMAGGQSMRQSCLKAGIGASTWLDWCAADRDLDERYARARLSLLDAMVDQIITLADSPVAVLDTGATDPALVRQRQLQIDARRWILSKLAPRIYGDKLDVNVSDTRISISGALAAAQARLVDVIDVTPVHALHNVHSAQEVHSAYVHSASDNVHSAPDAPPKPRRLLLDSYIDD